MVANSARKQKPPDMTLQDYIQNTVLRTESKTLPSPDTHFWRVAHAGLGFTSEIGELCSALATLDKVNVIEELGDMMWYVGLGLDELGGPTVSYSPPEAIGNCMEQLTGAASLINNKLKRHAFYGEPMDNVSLREYFSHVLEAISRLCVLLGLSLDMVLRKNHDKLKKRYPKNFTKAKALKRNLAAERKSLESPHHD